MDRQPEPKVDFTHPLTSLEWKESEMPVGVYNSQAVVLGSKVYIGGGSMSPGPSSILLVYDFTKDSWEKLDTPTEWYALTTYHSQLVLIGGVDPNTRNIADPVTRKASTTNHDTGKVNIVDPTTNLDNADTTADTRRATTMNDDRATNQLWVLDEQHHWTQPLPPMAIKRLQASAVSVGDHLIVAGGQGVGPLDAVEVYDGHQWREAQSLPIAQSWMKSVLHEGKWYLDGGAQAEEDCKIYYTSLESLIATTHSEGDKQSSVWKELPGSPLLWSTPAVFKNQLISVAGYYSSAIHAYFPSNMSAWVHVGDLPVACYSTCTLVLPTGELLVIGGDSEYGPSPISFTASIGVTSFPDGHFSMSALDCLEKVAGISIVNKLAKKFLDNKLTSKLPFSEQIFRMFKNNPVEGSKIMLKTWVSTKGHPPPTWQELMKLFQDNQMGEVVQEIEDYFNKVSATSPSVSLISEDKGKELDMEMDEIEKKERKTKPDYKDVAVQNSCDSQEMAVQTYEPAAMEITGYLRGVDVIGETSVVVTNEPQTFHWTGYGLKIHIPQGALPDGLEDCRLLLKVGLSGQFALPKNTSLVSAVYWLDSEPRCKFSQPLTLEIQHCAKSSQISRLNFILAKCSQGNLPYTFETLEGGKFSSQSAYGCIQLYHFSLITLVKRLLVGEDNIRYRASLYFLKKGEYQREIHFVITKDQEAHATKVRQEYTAKGATIGPDLKIEFQSSSISLQLPSEGVTLQDGWRIIPFFHPGITKEDVDNFETGRRIPSCQLRAVWTKKSKPPALIHKVTLEGAKEPFNYFSIILDCDSTPPDGDPTSGLTQDQDLRSKYASGLDSEPELLDLMNEVAAEIPRKWRDIGLQLGLDHGILDGIATISPGDNNHCYSNVFTLWKKRNLPTHPYTWLTIVQALQSKAVGEKRLAEKITKALIGLQSL